MQEVFKEINVKASHTGAEPGIILPFSFSMALCAASALLNSTKQYPAGFLETHRNSKICEHAYFFSSDNTNSK